MTPSQQFLYKKRNFAIQTLQKQNLLYFYMKPKHLLTTALALCLSGSAIAQSEIYPQHFNLKGLFSD